MGCSAIISGFTPDVPVALLDLHPLNIDMEIICFFLVINKKSKQIVCFIKGNKRAIWKTSKIHNNEKMTVIKIISNKLIKNSYPEEKIQLVNLLPFGGGQRHFPILTVLARP